MNVAEEIMNLGDLPAFASLTGKFHAHLTVETCEDRLEELKDLCKSLKTKLTVIDLHNFDGRHQSDVMLTCYFHDTQPGAVGRFATRLAGYAQNLQEHGFNVLRGKMEHESLPSISPYTKANYHEVHFKLLIEESKFESIFEKLKKLSGSYGFVPSQNPYEKKDNGVTQFINLRIYDGTQESADQKVHEIHTVLEELDLKVLETKRETIVFDTFRKLDQWWI